MIKQISFAALAVALAGCASMPTADEAEVKGKVFGNTAAVVCNMVTMTDLQRAAVRDIVVKVRDCVPSATQTFADVWTPIAEQYVTEAIQAGKIPQSMGDVIVKAFNKLVQSADWIVAKKWPKIKEDAEVCTAGVHGLCDGFLANFTVESGRAINGDVEVSRDLFDYLTKK